MRLRHQTSLIFTLLVCGLWADQKFKLSRCILQAGSQSTFTNEFLVEALQQNVTDTKDLVVTTTEQTSSSSSLRRLVHFDVAGYSRKANISISAFESNNTYSSLPTVLQDVDVLAHTRNNKLANPTTGLENLYAEVRIEVDHYC